MLEGLNRYDEVPLFQLNVVGGCVDDCNLALEILFNGVDGLSPDYKAGPRVIEGGDVGGLGCPVSLEPGRDDGGRLSWQLHLLSHHQGVIDGSYWSIDMWYWLCRKVPFG